MELPIIRIVAARGMTKCLLLITKGEGWTNFKIKM